MASNDSDLKVLKHSIEVEMIMRKCVYGSFVCVYMQRHTQSSIQ